MIAMDAALERWMKERTPENRDRLVSSYAHLCARASRKFQRPGLERADLRQIAALGLLKACDKYDARLATPFEAFAWLFIVGELMHYVRDHERMVRPPRRLRSLERRYQAAHETLTGELEREPRQNELAQHLGVGLQDVRDVEMFRDRSILESLESLKGHQLRPCSYTLDARDDRIVLDAALERLTTVERTIILALYGAGYSQSEVASRLGYSRRHISRLHRAALRKMQPLWVSASP
jgi:RNA polymerase sigma-B factor